MLLIETVITPGTDRQAAMAIQRFLSSITEKHSVTSRRHAITTLLKEEVDGEVARVLATYQGDWDRELLEDFIPSKAWLRVPAGDKPVFGSTTLTTAIGRAERWRSRLRLAIRSAQSYAPSPSSKACLRFCGTLDTLMRLIDTISRKQPSHTGGPTGRVYLKAKGRYADYCDLCWRPSEVMAHGDQRDEDNRKLSTSRRFCSEHNPQTAASNYRRDLKYKAEFLAEIEQIRALGLAQHETQFKFFPNSNTPSGLQLHLVPVSAHPEDVRRAAYALVHSKLRGTPAQCLAFIKIRRLSPKETAARLGITDRAVRQALSTFMSKLKQVEQIRWGAAPRSKFESFLARQPVLP